MPKHQPPPAELVLKDIRPGQSIELLKELHILTRDGKLNQDTRRKLKQVYHLFQFIEPLMQDLLNRNIPLTLADHGAGKSYLGFMVYDLFLNPQQTGEIIGIETRAELVSKSTQLAQRLGFDRMRFLNISVDDAITSPALPAKIGIVTALHACNTATDDAIRFALLKQAEHIVLVPCCQAEVASELKQHKNASLSQTPLAEIWRHPIHSREFGSHLTNVLRCLLLEANGYQLTVTELVGWEHSMKNELIIATRTGKPRGNAAERALAILDTMNLNSLRERFVYRL